jgi:D-proline reductase (dithiol) PrdB
VGELSEFPLHYRAFLRTYRWRRIEPLPFTRLKAPVYRARVAIVSSAGLVAPGDAAFDPRVRGGDSSYRWIESGVNPRRLIETHRSDAWDHQGFARDPNVVFPLERLRELAEAKVIGAVNRRHASIMGSLTAPGRLVRHSAPEIAAGLTSDEVDVAVLVPV